MGRRLDVAAQAFLLAAGAYSAATAAWALLPAELWMPRDIAYAVAANNCALAELQAEAVASDDRVAEKMFPIVVVRRGEQESPAAVASCHRIARTVRGAGPIFWLVPRRFICSRVRSWARDSAEDAGYSIGSEIWIIGGNVVAPADRYEAVTRLGLWHERAGLRHRLRFIEEGESVESLRERAQLSLAAAGLSNAAAAGGGGSSSASQGGAVGSSGDGE